MNFIYTFLITDREAGLEPYLITLICHDINNAMEHLLMALNNDQVSPKDQQFTKEDLPNLVSRFTSVDPFTREVLYHFKEHTQKGSGNWMLRAKPWLTKNL